MNKSIWVWGAAWLCAASGATAQLPAIPPGAITVELGDWVRMPDTRGSGMENPVTGANYARINFLRDVGDGRVMINDLRGQLYTVDMRTGAVSEYLDFNDVFSEFIIGPGGLSTGLITVALHPEFAGNGKFYTIHEESADGNPATADFFAQGDAGNLANGQHGVVVEWTANNPQADVFAGTHRELMRVAQPQGNLHNLGDVGFNPAAQPGEADYGLLYIAGGDGGYDADDKGSEQAQNINSIFGKVLRIDPTPGGGNAYTVPADNPFVGVAGLDEIYAYGFRNAHRIMWDQDGTLYTTDIGQHNIEEINLLHAGANYGWSSREGTFEYNDDDTFGDPVTNPAADGFTYPVAQYDHGEGDAIAGGFVYRGDRIPELVGKFVFGDIVQGRLFYADVDDLLAADADNSSATAAIYELFITRNGAATTLAELVADALGVAVEDLPSDRVDLRFGQTDDGEIFITTKADGWVRVFRPDVGVLPGDANNDGVVDGGDFIAVREAFGGVGLSDGYMVGDANDDGRVDGGDLLSIDRHMGEALPSGSFVPEPASGLVVLGGIGVVVGRRRHTLR